MNLWERKPQNSFKSALCRLVREKGERERKKRNRERKGFVRLLVGRPVGHNFLKRHFHAFIGALVICILDLY